VKFTFQDQAQGCGGIVTATGNFRTNGVGGTVRYQWIRKDSSGTRTTAVATVVVAAGDTAVHNVTTDRWTPQSGGTEQLVFLAPAAPAIAAQAWRC
jgi:hypothetical protein